MTRIDPEEYAELVLQCVEQIPRGRVSTYGAIAEVVGAVLGGGGPRQVGSVMSGHGGPVPWWRVVRSNGTLPDSHQDEARQAYLEEATPMRPSGNVDLRAAFFRPSLVRRPGRRSGEDVATTRAQPRAIQPEAAASSGAASSSPPPGRSVSTVKRTAP